MHVVSQLIPMNSDTLQFTTMRYDASDSDAYIHYLVRFNTMYAINVGQHGHSVLIVIRHFRSRTQLNAAW